MMPRPPIIFESNHEIGHGFHISKSRNRIKIIKSLWKIIYSNQEADIYETNLMRRLAGLLYIDSKIMGDIKEQVKKEIVK